LSTVRGSLQPIRQSARTFSLSTRKQQHFLNVDSQGFEAAISAKRSEGKVILVDFYADWCGPCKTLSPILERLTENASVKSGSGRSLDLVTVDTDNETELAVKYGIRSLPTVIAFRDGQPVTKFMGALPEASVRKFLETV